MRRPLLLLLMIDDLFNSAQFYKTYRLNLHRQLNTEQLRKNYNKTGASWDHPNSKG